MTDRLPEALQYHGQGYRPIATKEKIAVETWERFQHHSPTAYDRHRWWPSRGKHDHNIALILGPKPGGDLLALNINCKNGVDGFATLTQLGWEIPPTPTIRTPSGGRCHFFKVPDPDLFPFPFLTHVHPPGYEGLEFRGARGYQLVPPSRLKHGTYRFLKPWRLDRLRVDLAELPGAILQAWVQLDRGAEQFTRRRAQNGDAHSHTSQPPTASASAPPTDLIPHTTPTPSSHVRTPLKAKTTAQDLTTITTALSPEDYSDFDVGEVAIQDRACAEHLSRQFRLEVARLDDGQSMLCVLPGHREHTPSATWFRTNSGHYIYHDWHARSGHAYYPVPDVFAALMTGKVKSLPKPSRKTWRLRLMVEAGLLDPYPVAMKPFPEDMPKLLRHFCERFQYLCACKWTYQEQAPTMFSDEFAAGWSGIREGSIWKLRRLALIQGFLVTARDDQGRLVYLPGKEMSSDAQ